ncbi:UDP-N-acetylmuramate dehydrogenase [Granulicella cerasi]|uniref:UDP-N-acetylenolpyruvoylglucosamine reductase n=1 Tax=Granulicella cerasi TaxID=741063 RepID=A0ABW1ZED9_9BACT|nr:UDP-N-acetylmuramate dehydrogenase [Granulicella cerasi]
MTFQVEENVPLAPLTTFGVGGRARWFARATSEADVAEAVNWAAARGVPLFVLGGGSNLLVADEGFKGLVLRMEIGGIEAVGGGRFVVGAGVEWDEFVTRVVSAGFAGVECMAGIPGSVGGTPVQNVGAYGQEVAEVIDAVRVFDREKLIFVWLDNKDCGFRYRESRFNIDEPGRFVVTSVRFQLKQGGAPNLKYADLRKRFGLDVNPEAAKPSLQEVAVAVREIRASKGMLHSPNDADSRSAGSFFKNPIVSDSLVGSIAQAASVATENVPRWPAGAGLVKLPAAWLLERAGFVKGFGSGRVGVSTKHTLALVNRGEASFADVEQMQAEIVAKVEALFGVRLVREPVKLG